MEIKKKKIKKNNIKIEGFFQLHLCESKINTGVFQLYSPFVVRVTEMF